LLGAKVENLLFLGLGGNAGTVKIQLGIPAKMAFLKEQVLEATAKEKLLNLIVAKWGMNSTFELSIAKDGADVAKNATSAKTMEVEIEKKKNKDLTEQIAAHPKVKAANAIFKGQIKEIKEKT